MLIVESKGRGPGESRTQGSSPPLHTVLSSAAELRVSRRACWTNESDNYFEVCKKKKHFVNLVHKENMRKIVIPILNNLFIIFDWRKV